MEGYQSRKIQRQFIISWQEMAWNGTREFDAIIFPQKQTLNLIKLCIFLLLKSGKTHNEIKSDRIIRMVRIEGTAEFKLW